MDNICFDKNDQTLEIINQTQQLSVVKIENNDNEKINLRNDSRSSKNTITTNNFS